MNNPDVDSDKPTIKSTKAAFLSRLQRSALFDSRLNGALTIIIVVLLAIFCVPALKWLLFDAVWSGQPDDCRIEGAGACWVAINDKISLILFGTYPHDQHWRAALSIIVVACLFIVSMFQAMHNKYLLVGWGAVLVVICILLGGGVFGLTAVPTRHWSGLPLTLVLSLFGIALSFPLAVLLALGRTNKLPVVRIMIYSFVEAVRGVPLVMLLFMGYLILPFFFPIAYTPGTLYRAQFAIVVFYAVVNSEVIRGGLQSIPPSQYEAAAALGLGYWSTTFFVVLPQALRAVLPALVTNVILTIKDTSLVTIISLIDFFGASKISAQDLLWGNIHSEIYLFVAAVYFVICFGVSRVGKEIERGPKAKQEKL